MGCMSEAYYTKFCSTCYLTLHVNGGFHVATYTLFGMTFNNISIDYLLNSVQLYKLGLWKLGGGG